MLLLNINRKPSMGSPMVPLDFILSDTEMSVKITQIWKVLYIGREPS